MRLHRFLILGVFFLANGCSAPVGSVTGIITLDGKPLPDAHVLFHPITAGPVALAKSDENGSYTLHIDERTQIPAGEYLVTVTTTRPRQGELGKILADTFPRIYSSKETSGLRFTVQPRSQTIDLKLIDPNPPKKKTK
jgi:hypothetical protein